MPLAWRHAAASSTQASIAAQSCACARLLQLDMPGRGGDAVAVGELLDERDLPLDGPAVVARADGDGGEVYWEFW